MHQTRITLRWYELHRLCAGIQIYIYLDSSVHSFIHLHIYANLEIFKSGSVPCARIIWLVEFLNNVSHDITSLCKKAEVCQGINNSALEVNYRKVLFRHELFLIRLWGRWVLGFLPPHGLLEDRDALWQKSWIIWLKSEKKSDKESSVALRSSGRSLPEPHISICLIQFTVYSNTTLWK